MNNEEVRNCLLYVRARLQDERGSDFSGVKALRLAILKYIPEGYTVLDEDNICMFCNAKIYPVDIDNGTYRFCPNCGCKIIYN